MSEVHRRLPHVGNRSQPASAAHVVVCVLKRRGSGMSDDIVNVTTIY
jgi:hypothetical protein